jgi:penicillin-binding protein 1A
MDLLSELFPDPVRKLKLSGSQRYARLGASLTAGLAVTGSLLVLAPVALEVGATSQNIGLPPERTATAFTFLDSNGNVLGHRGPVAGQHVALKALPPYLPAAFIAMEDRRFYSHHGLDVLGLWRAAYQDIRAHHVVAGGSTITQQTAKILYDRRERTLRRKVDELFQAFRLEGSLTKDEILEIYLNRLYLGDGAYGVDTASRTYFGVPATQVSLAQAAMLAALTRAPSVFSPRRDLAAARRRAARVLSAMVETGAISLEQARIAVAHPPQIIDRPRDTHGYAIDAAANEAESLAKQSGLGGNLIVRTSLDTGLGGNVQAAARDAVARFGTKMNFDQAAIIVMRPDGAVTALTGGVDYARSVFNRATQARRQPGSAFKPFVYLAALQAGISPWDTRSARSVDIDGYEPSNYNNRSYGHLRLIDALARSVNTFTVNLAEEVGRGHVVAAARMAGITSPLQENASLALGTNEVVPIELASAYCFFANGGYRTKAHLVSEIDRPDGRPLYRWPPDTKSPMMSDQVRQDMTALLYRVVANGTGTAARLPGRDVAGKTGTTQDSRDGWFVGFTTDFVAAVWLGNDDNSPMRKVTGGSIPAETWNRVMTVAEIGYPARPLERSQPPVTDLTDDSAPIYDGEIAQGLLTNEAATSGESAAVSPSEFPAPMTESHATQNAAVNTGPATVSTAPELGQTASPIEAQRPPN